MAAQVFSSLDRKRVYRKALQIAAKEAYHSEVIETNMKHIIIGPEGDCASKKNWINDRIDSWMAEARDKTN